jgi:hypothetical protein
VYVHIYIYIYIYMHINYQQLYCIVTSLNCCRLGRGLDDQSTIPGVERYFFLLQRLQTSSEAKAAFSQILCWAVASLVKRAGREADYPSPSSVGTRTA